MSIRRKPKSRRLSVAKPVVARKRNARKKIKLVVAKPAARRKRNARRVVAASAPAIMTVVTKKRKANRKPRRKAKRAANRRRRNPSSALATLSPLRRRGLVAAHTVGGKGLAKGRKSNKGRRRHALRKRNPGFDVQKVLIKGAVLIAGAYVAKTITDKVVDLCVDTLKIKDDSTLGYVQLLGAIGVVALGEYLQSEFGSPSFDLQPATYAIASFMATDGLNRAFPPAPKKEAATGTGDGSTPAPMNGTMITEYSPSAMNGTMNASGELPYGYSMLGSLFTDSELPGPAVAPHNVMQGHGGLAYGASGLAYGSAGVPSLV